MTERIKIESDVMELLSVRLLPGEKIVKAYRVDKELEREMLKGFEEDQCLMFPFIPLFLMELVLCGPCNAEILCDMYNPGMYYRRLLYRKKLIITNKGLYFITKERKPGEAGKMKCWGTFVTGVADADEETEVTFISWESVGSISTSRMAASSDIGICHGTGVLLRYAVVVNQGTALEQQMFVRNPLDHIKELKDLQVQFLRERRMDATENILYAEPVYPVEEMEKY